jgi:hypothetical protein
MKLNLLKGIYSTSYSPNVIGNFSVWYRWDFSKWILSSTFVSVVNASSSGSICSIETRVGLVSFSNSFRVFLSDSINPTHAKVAGSVQKLQRKSLHSDDRISYDIVVRSDILGENTVDIFNKDDVSLCSVTFYLHAVMVISSFLPSVSVSSSFRASIFGGPFLHDWKYFCIVDRAFVIPAVVIDHSVLQCLIHVEGRRNHTVFVSMDGNSAASNSLTFFVLDPPTISFVLPKAISMNLDQVITMFGKGFASAPSSSLSKVTL